MSEVTLVIGHKRTSAWSLRPWLFLQHHGVSFRERILSQEQPGAQAEITRLSPSGRLPVLLGADFAVWESLAICEFAAEWFALPAAWPMAPAARAMARSVCHEMQSGFVHLRRELSFDAARLPLATAMSVNTQAEIARIRGIWRSARTRFGTHGDWLFGQFGIADAMFAPVALRFHQYAIALEGPEREYVSQVLDHHAVQAWMDHVANAPPTERTVAPMTRSGL